MNACRGFSMIEVLFAVVVLAAASITASQALLSVQDQDDNRSRTSLAQHLLQDGLAVVRSLPRIDGSTPVFGAEADDAGIDDADDYNGITETGPTDLIGLAFDKLWQRTWKVTSADLASPDKDVAPGASSLMRVCISVSYNGSELATTTLLLARTP
jgi:prepilin-type N-terminal cleavage/methylation domain-containing protein